MEFKSVAGDVDGGRHAPFVARPEWHAPVTTVLEIADWTLSKSGGDADSCDSTHGHS